MSITFRSIVEAARFRADMSVNGVGPHASDRVTDPEFRELLNDAINHAWAVASAARPDFQTASQDFTVVSGGSASFAVPTNFYSLLDVVFAPDTTSEYSLGPYAWQNRRAPGGWGPPYLTGVAMGGSGVQLMGGSVYIEPSTRAGGSYRCWYCPTPKLIRADITARLATVAALSPSANAAGSGTAKTLAGSVNGALSIDGTPVVVNDVVLVKDETNQVNNGPYVVLATGSGVAAYLLQRSTTANVTVTQAPGLGTMVYVSAGSANVDRFFETTSLATVVDSTAWTWAEAFLDPILEPRVELLKIKTALPAIDRDDDLSLTQLNRDLTKQEAMFATYLKQVRTANGPRKMIDADAMGPRGWGGGW